MGKVLSYLLELRGKCFFSSCGNMKILKNFPPFLSILHQYRTEIISTFPQEKKIIPKMLFEEVEELEKEEMKTERN